MSSAIGKLIVIEGLEGAGKSTAVKTVLDLLAQAKIEAISTREPGGTGIGETLREIIKNTDYIDVLDDKSELLLLYTARIQLLEEVIKPALQQGYWVVADRFELSSKAYQGGGRGLSVELIQQLSDFCLQGFKPDLTLYLDISPELGMQRAKLRGSFDRIEHQSIDFFERVQQTYLSLVENNDSIIKIDASHSLEEVQTAVKKAVMPFVGLVNE